MSWPFTGKFFFVAVVVLCLQALPAHADSLGFSLNDSSDTPLSDVWDRLRGIRPARLTVQVFDDRTYEPIEGADVRITDSIQSDARDPDTREGISRRDGREHFEIPRDTPKTVTVFKDGYAMTTVSGIETRTAQIYLKPLLPSRDSSGEDSYTVVSGTMGNYVVPSDSKKVRFGVVIRSLSAFDLLGFDVASLISPLNDEIDVWGKRQIPSNVVLPDQKVSVFPVTIGLKKLGYRLPLFPGVETTLTGVQAEIATSDAVDFMTGKQKPSLASINLITVNRVGVTPLFVPDAGTPQDVPATAAISPRSYSVAISPPPFNATVVVAALKDVYGDRRALVPTDIKASVPKNGAYPSLALGTANFQARNDTFVAAAITDDRKQISGVVFQSPDRQFTATGFLAVDAEPDFNHLPSSVNIDAPQTGVASAVFSTHIQLLGNAKPKTVPVWYVFALPVARQTVIPTANGPEHMSLDEYAITQMDFGASFDAHALNGRTIIQQLERFTQANASQL